ncbi:hypothetical protein ACHAQA_007635 [Verticillium albo-atrum]
MEEFMNHPVVQAALSGGKFLGVQCKDEGPWQETYFIYVQFQDETHKLLIKILRGENSTLMVRGEYESNLALRQCLPENVCPIVGWGVLEHNSWLSFVLSQVRAVRSGPIGHKALASMMKRMHSTTISPNGMFGFHVCTYRGFFPVDNSWCDTWEGYFTRTFRDAVRWNHDIHKDDPSFLDVAELFCAKVIPRLLRPLTTGGNTILPVLLHGNFSDRSVQVDTETEKTMISSACCCYGHYESQSMECNSDKLSERPVELGPVGTKRYSMGTQYINQYVKAMGPSKPKEDFQDRLRLYAMIKKGMLEMIEKYPYGYNDFTFNVTPGITIPPRPETPANFDMGGLLNDPMTWSQAEMTEQNVATSS